MDSSHRTKRITHISIKHRKIHKAFRLNLIMQVKRRKKKHHAGPMQLYVPVNELLGNKL